MTTFFSSDLHFGHNRAFIYEPRGFSSIEEHDAAIVENWNSMVGSHDVCYLLGDCMLGANHEYGLNLLRQLNGHLFFIRGNHDTDTRWNEYMTLPNCQGVLGYATIVKDLGYKFYLCHYPTETSCLENMAKLKHHLINLHGHTHSPHVFEKDKPYQYNVALDAHDCFPVSTAEILTDIEHEVTKCLSYLQCKIFTDYNFLL